MPPIDYTIPGQFQRVQLEPPENAMARVMQLRGLQETSQMNALRAQEYQQKQQEAQQLQQDKNKLAQILSAHEYGTPEFISAIQKNLPHHLPTVLENIDKFETAKSLRTKREEEATTAQRKNKEARRATAISQIASARSPQEALEMSQAAFAAGDIGQLEVNSLLDELYNAPKMKDFSQGRRIGLLDPKEALAEGREAEAANVKQIDTRRKQFDLMYPPNLIQSAEDVKNRILAQANDPVLKQLLTQFGTLEEIIARDVAEFGRDSLGYKQRLAGVPTADILKAAEDKKDKEYSQYRLNELLNRRQPLTQEEYFKRNRGEAVTPVAAADGATSVAAPVVTADGTTSVAAPVVTADAPA